MDKDNRALVLECYHRYLNAVIEADIDAINECIEYPLAYIGGGSVKMLDKFPIDPREWKEKPGWATSNAFEIDVVAVTEKKAHVLMQNCRRLRDDDPLLKKQVHFMHLRSQTEDGKCTHSQTSHSQLNRLLYRSFAG